MESTENTCPINTKFNFFEELGNVILDKARDATPQELGKGILIITGIAISSGIISALIFGAVTNNLISSGVNPMNHLFQTVTSINSDTLLFGGGILLLALTTLAAIQLLIPTLSALSLTHSAVQLAI